MSQWIEWEGGKCPVPEDTIVDVALRGGIVRSESRASELLWANYPSTVGLSPHDIVAYRVTTQQAEPTGRKDDSKKWRFSLLPWNCLLEVIKVLEFGATKYAPNNWQKVENAKESYFNEAMSHLTAWWSGEKNDPETNLSHLAHAICCLLFAMWFDKENK